MGASRSDLAPDQGRRRRLHDPYIVDERQLHRAVIEAKYASVCQLVLVTGRLESFIPLTHPGIPFALH